MLTNFARSMLKVFSELEGAQQYNLGQRARPQCPFHEVFYLSRNARSHQPSSTTHRANNNNITCDIVLLELPLSLRS